MCTVGTLYCESCVEILQYSKHSVGGKLSCVWLEYKRDTENLEVYGLQ